MENVETVETQNTQVESQEVVQETKDVAKDIEVKKSSSEILRELSKKFSVNLFDDTGVEAFLEKINSNETKVDSLQQQYEKAISEKDTLTKREMELATKVEALSLGFNATELDEVLALAKVNMKEGQTIQDGLKVVKEKYGSVFAKQEIGRVHRDGQGDKPDVAKTEQEKYLAKSKAYQMYKK